MYKCFGINNKSDNIIRLKKNWQAWSIEFKTKVGLDSVSRFYDRKLQIKVDNFLLIQPLSICTFKNAASEMSPVIYKISQDCFPKYMLWIHFSNWLILANIK